MTDGKNQDWIASRGWSCHWSLHAASRADSVSDVKDEFKTVCEDIQRAAGHLFIPTYVDFHVKEIGTDGPAAVAHPDHPDYIHPEKWNISYMDGDGISSEQIVCQISELRTDNDTIPYLQSVSLFGMSNLYLDDGLHTIDIDDNKYKSWTKNRGLTEAEPSVAPLEMKIKRGALSFNRSDLDHDTEYVIVVKTGTDIWFEDTDIGRINRAQLTAFLARLFGVFDVYSVVTSNECPAKDIITDITDRSILE